MTIKQEEIFVNEKHWEHMNPNDLDHFVTKIFNYYRNGGFPYYSINMETRHKDFNTLKNYDRSNLFENNIVKQTMHGLGLAWSYFPHAFNVKCNDKMTPYDAFMDDDIFMKVIRKRLKMGTYISDSGIRKMLKIFTNVQGVSNFRPTAAARIYDMFAKDGVVWDMSGGWGGRLLGAIISDVKMYIATEPSELTFNGLNELARDFSNGMSYDIKKIGSEEYKPNQNSLDLCFTSPPYFDLEKYSDESTQSYIKFKTKKDWVDGYLHKTYENCYHGLKRGGNMIINIADAKGKFNLNLVNETIDIAKRIGFECTNEYKLALSNLKLKNKVDKFKYEPILVFKK